MKTMIPIGLQKINGAQNRREFYVNGKIKRRRSRAMFKRVQKHIKKHGAYKTYDELINDLSNNICNIRPKLVTYLIQKFDKTFYIEDSEAKSESEAVSEEELDDSASDPDYIEGQSEEEFEEEFEEEEEYSYSDEDD